MNMNRVQKEMHGHVNHYINSRIEVPATITFTNDKPDTKCTALLNVKHVLLGAEIDENLQYLGVLCSKNITLEPSHDSIIRKLSTTIPPTGRTMNMNNNRPTRRALTTKVKRIPARTALTTKVKHIPARTARRNKQ